MKMSLLLRSGNVCGTSGTIARKRIAEESISDAIFAPLEYPTDITCCKSNHKFLMHQLQSLLAHLSGISNLLNQKLLLLVCERI